VSGPPTLRNALQLGLFENPRAMAQIQVLGLATDVACRSRSKPVQRDPMLAFEDAPRAHIAHNLADVVTGRVAGEKVSGTIRKAKAESTRPPISSIKVGTRRSRPPRLAQSLTAQRVERRRRPFDLLSCAPICQGLTLYQRKKVIYREECVTALWLSPA
jgi:hypothetical protein